MRKTLQVLGSTGVHVIATAGALALMRWRGAPTDRAVIGVYLLLGLGFASVALLRGIGSRVRTTRARIGSAMRLSSPLLILWWASQADASLALAAAGVLVGLTGVYLQRSAAVPAGHANG